MDIYEWAVVNLYGVHGQTFGKDNGLKRSGYRRVEKYVVCSFICLHVHFVDIPVKYKTKILDGKKVHIRIVYVLPYRFAETVI